MYPDLVVIGKTIQDDKEKVQEFNKFFTSMSNLDQEVIPELVEADKKENILTDIHLPCLTSWKLLQTASGPDGISSRILRETDISTAPSLKDPQLQYSNGEVTRNMEDG